MPDAPTPKPGLQIERTQLAWERSGIGYLTIGGILMFHADSPLARGRIVLAVLAICMAALTFAIAQARGRSGPIGDRGERRMIRSLDRGVTLTGWATTVLAALIVVTIMWGT